MSRRIEPYLEPAERLGSQVLTTPSEYADVLVDGARERAALLRAEGCGDEECEYDRDLRARVLE